MVHLHLGVSLVSMCRLYWSIFSLSARFEQYRTVNWEIGSVFAFLYFSCILGIRPILQVFTPLGLRSHILNAAGKKQIEKRGWRGWRWESDKYWMWMDDTRWPKDYVTTKGISYKARREEHSPHECMTPPMTPIESHIAKELSSKHKNSNRKKRQRQREMVGLQIKWQKAHKTAAKEIKMHHVITSALASLTESLCKMWWVKAIAVSELVIGTMERLFKDHRRDMRWRRYNLDTDSRKRWRIFCFGWRIHNDTQFKEFKRNKIQMNLSRTRRSTWVPLGCLDKFKARRYFVHASLLTITGPNLFVGPQWSAL